MSRATAISWTESTWNCLRGCSRISEGCRFCYAESLAARFSLPGQPWEGYATRNPSRWTGKVALVPDKLLEPLTWTKGSLIFVNSMSDLFHESLPDEVIVRVFEVMRLADWHVYQPLTKRADRMAAMLGGVLRPYADLEHIWFGVSVDDRRSGLPRMELLRRTPARVRWLSVEPLLEDLGQIDFTGIDWVVTGGESGRHLLDPALCSRRGVVELRNGRWVPREDRLDWFRSIRDRCNDQFVPYYHKQHGGPKPLSAGRVLDGRTWDEYPEFEFRECPPMAERRRRKEWAQQHLVGSTADAALSQLPATGLVLGGGAA